MQYDGYVCGMDFAGFVEKKLCSHFCSQDFLDGNPKKVWTKFSLCKGWPWAREMGKAMKAMKGHKPKSILKKKQQKPTRNISKQEPCPRAKEPCPRAKEP